MIPFILSLAIFLIFGLIATFFILNAGSKKKNRLMKVVRGENYAPANKTKKVNEQDQRRSDLAKKLKESEKLDSKKSNTIQDKIMQAGLPFTVKQYWSGSLISGAVFLGIAAALKLSPFMMVMLFIIGLLGLPRFFLKIKIARRQKAFMDEFADALESMMRLLKAGMPVSEAIRMVSREFSGPMGEEMGRIYDQQKIGIPLPEAVLDSARRMPLTEMQMFATAIAIQTQTGSSLSEVLQNLATVIRSRFKLKRKIKALSSEAKASAAIIGALPVIVGLGMYFINREYINILLTEPTGQFLLGCAIGWMCVGIFIMRQMINFKV